MPTLREYWRSGFRALHIEESISNAFADFAPYASADEQRVVFTRQSSLTAPAPTNASPTASVGTPLGPASYVNSSTSVIMEESGDFMVQAREPNAGCVTFSTAGHLQLDAAVRVSLPPPFLRPTAVDLNSEGDATISDSADLSKASSPPHLQVKQQQQQRSSENFIIHPVVKPSPSQLRFSDYAQPVSAPSWQPTQTVAHRSADSVVGSFGQLEVDASMPNWDSNRLSMGARIGPAAVRVTRTFSAAATATATEAAAASQLRNSASLSEDETGVDALTRTLQLERARKYQHTVDAALCLPFGGGTPYSSKLESGKLKEEVTRTLRGDRIALRTAPWAMSCGLQFPFGLGDTLIGIGLQNDRATSVSLPYPGVEWAVSAASLPSFSSPAGPAAGEQENINAARKDGDTVCVACVPSPFYSRNAMTSAKSGEYDTVTTQLPSYIALPYFTFRFLIVQTLASHTLVRDTSPHSSPQRDEGGNTSLNASGMTHLSSSYDWRRLPTLVGVNVGLDRERLRLSAASIVHDGGMDLEVAGVLDMTPWTPRMPSLVKVGYNNVGRFAACITSLFYETVSATLGIHVARGEQAKFGIEVKF